MSTPATPPVVTVPMTARFVPQAWINDYAVEVDPWGDQEWDCTAAYAALPAQYRDDLDTEIEEGGEALDRDDHLKGDENAPEWVRNWQGPFDIYVRPTNNDDDIEEETTGA